MLGDTCGDCQIVVGDSCLPCPDGTDFPECQGCIDGERTPTTDLTKDVLLPVAIGIVTTLTVALIMRQMNR